MGYHWKDDPTRSEYIDDTTGEPVAVVLMAGPYPGIGTSYHIEGSGITPLEGGYPTLGTAKTAVASQVRAATQGAGSGP